MLRIIIFILMLMYILQADILTFYKSATKTLSYNKSYLQHQHSLKLSQDAISKSQYLDLYVDTSFTTTKTKRDPYSFNSFDISLNDDLDIFNKKKYLIDAITLDKKTQNYLLKSKKEKLFTSLVFMVSLYNATKKKIVLNQGFYNEQDSIYKKLSILHSHGAISNLVLLRFKNTLTSLQTKIIQEKNQLSMMKKQLNLYAPTQKIPTLKDTLKYSKSDFLAQNPQIKLNNILADKSLLKSKALKDSYLPELSTTIAYQKLDDPTSYGDNYSFSISLHIPLKSSDFKEAEALEVESLNEKSKNIELKLQREKEYLSFFQNYKSAKEQLKILKTNLNDYEKSKKTIKNAFLKQFVDFNSYIQVLSETLSIQEQIINLQSQANKNATVLNLISSRVIYE